MLWILKWNKPSGFDVVNAFVIRASSPRTARKLAADSCRDEGRDIWLDISKSTCTQLKEDGENNVIMRDTTDG